MDLKLLEDLVALAQERSFVRAAEKRNVTHPAFGRRIKTLEAWASVPLVDRSSSPVKLTEAGQTLLAQAQQVVHGMQHTRLQLRTQLAQTGRVLRVATGRTLARTVVADWLVQMTKPRGPLLGRKIEVRTGSVSDTVAMMERNEVDLMCCYEHPAMSVKLNTQRYRHLTLAHDKLVPVSRSRSPGVAMYDLASAPLIAYGPTLSLGALLASHGCFTSPEVQSRTQYVCDSADAIQEYALKGLGVAWLPWSLVITDCKRGTLMALGKRSDEVHFDVRLYRRTHRLSADIEAAWAATDV
ncbi:MAG: LysR family transcriptional regulator [Burkholderiaceae bacterium]|jgi:DNA-binding transcriptional LysR family regulator